LIPAIFENCLIILKIKKQQSMKKITSKFALLAITGAALVVAIGIQSCSKSSGGGGAPPLVPLGGYVSSDSVAPANLVAYWPFDADANDHKGGLTATATGTVTFVAGGVRGSAYQGQVGAYETLTVPSGGGVFTNIGSYSESFWYKLPSQDTLTQGVFFLEGSTTQNELMTEIEPYKPLALDSVRIHPGFNDLASPAYQQFVPETFDTAAIGKWVHFVVTYNAGNSTFITYQDAVPTGANTAFTNGMYLTPDAMWTDGTMTTPLGAIGFASDAPKTIVIGSWPDGLFGQSAIKNAYLGELDELRIFNKALTQQEVAGLFLNGQAGR
jgi:hypothetical protein